jgi:glycerophosphoryl diester phosphodiesterase
VPPTGLLFIEIKCGAEILPSIKRDLAKSPLNSAQVAMIAFSLAVATAAKTKLPEHQVYWIIEFERSDSRNSWKPPVEQLIERAVTARLDGLDLDARGPIDTGLVEKVHSAGLKLVAWTVDDLPLAERLRDLGVDAVATNRPRWLRQGLSGRAARPGSAGVLPTSQIRI